MYRGQKVLYPQGYSKVASFWKKARHVQSSSKFTGGCYMWNNSLIISNRDAKALSWFPKHLIPSEIECTECGEHASLHGPQLVSSTAKILTGLVKGL